MNRLGTTIWGTFEIAISPRSRYLLPSTRYDTVAGYRFDNRERAEQFCRELNHFCFQERFLVIRSGTHPLQPPPPHTAHVLKAAA